MKLEMKYGRCAHDIYKDFVFYVNIQPVKGGKELFLKIIFKILFLIDLPKSAGGTFYFILLLFTCYFGIWYFMVKWKRRSCIQ